MPGRLRRQVLVEAGNVAESVRTDSAMNLMPRVSISYCELPERVYNSCVLGDVELGEGASMHGCYVGAQARVKLGPGTVAYACMFLGDAIAGAGCTLLGVGVANDVNGGSLVCGDNCVLASVTVGRYKLYGRTGYSLSNAMEPGLLELGDRCAVLGCVFKLLAPHVTIGDGFVALRTVLEPGFNDKTTVSIGDDVTVVHGYGKVERSSIRDIPEQPAGGRFNDASLEEVCEVSRGGLDKYVQLLSHGGTVRVGSGVTLGTSMMLHAQQLLDIGDGCMIQPGSASHAQLRMLGGNIRLGKRSLLAVMSNTDERHQDAGGITARGNYGDISTGYRSRLCVTGVMHSADVGLMLGDNETGFL